MKEENLKCRCDFGNAAFSKMRLACRRFRVPKSGAGLFGDAIILSSLPSVENSC